MKWPQILGVFQIVFYVALSKYVVFDGLSMSVRPSVCLSKCLCFYAEQLLSTFVWGR